MSEPVENSLVDVCKNISERYEIHFVEIGADENHVHFLIQSVPKISVEIVDLGVRTPTAEQYSIIAVENELALPAILWDRTLDVKQDLTINPNYSFSSSATNNANRFALIFTQATVINSFENTANTVQVYQNAENLIVVLNGNSKPEGIINIYDVTGRKVFSQKVTGNINTLYMNNAIGVYMVQVQNATQVLNKKIAIH